MISVSALLIDDADWEFEVLTRLAEEFSRYSLEAQWAPSPERARQDDLGSFQIVIFDRGCARESVESEMRQLRDAGFDGRIIVVSNSYPQDMIDADLAAGADAGIAKSDLTAENIEATFDQLLANTGT